MVIKLTFITSNGEEYIVETNAGLSILEIARQNNIDIEGACEGSLACSTCHVILDEDSYNKLPPAEEAEEDMLDLAFGLESTSRLGCQIIITDEMNGASFRIP